MEKRITVALAGNPNAGKTSVFNQLTGARAHVGNYPGVTVEKKEGTVKHGGREIHLVDLPGTYSLTAYSLEELVAREYILDHRPDLVINVVDAANLERNLYLAVQFMEIGIPVVIALNMMDVAESRGLKIDIDKLSELLGTPVVPTVARSNKGLEKLLDTVLQTVDDSPENWAPKRIRYGPDLDVKITEIEGWLSRTQMPNEKLPARWLALKALEGDSQVRNLLTEDKKVFDRIDKATEEVKIHLRATVDDEPEGIIADHRYGFITSVTKQAVTTQLDLRKTVSDKIDLVVLNRMLGPFILLLVLYGIYQVVFSAGEAPVSWTETLFAWLSDGVSAVLPEGPLQSLITSGVIDGVGGVLGFVPLIAFMFFAIAILEDSGYMARIAFIMDRVLRTFGLHGNSVLALMIGGGISGGCAVPGVMAARTLRDPKERLATILVTPFMNCGAKLPVFAVLIAAFFADNQGQMMFILTLIAWVLALIAARLLRWTVLRGQHSPFVMELPPYRLPTLKGLLIHTWERVWQYIKKAGTIILAISVVMWALMTYPKPPESNTAVFEHQRQMLVQNLNAGPAGSFLSEKGALDEFRNMLREIKGTAAPQEQDHPTDRLNLAKAVSILSNGEPLPEGLAPFEDAARSYLEFMDQRKLLAGAETGAALRYSVAGRVGDALEFLSRPLGFDWRTNIALTGGFAAKEVVISTLGTAYSLGDTAEEDSAGLAQKLAAEKGWNPLVAMTLMLFVMMYSPCLVTVVTIGRESGWKWALFSVCYTTITAYVVCLIVAIGGRALGLGV